MNSNEIYQKYGQEMYFFILKNVKNKNITNDIFQSSFLKIHKNIHQLKDEQKSRAWVFQICRNEVANYFNKELTHSNSNTTTLPLHDIHEVYGDICCLDRFIDDLPQTHKEVIVLTYIEGKKQVEVAEILKISIANVKARIRRSKAMLKKRFLECCKYEINKKGKLIGAPDCRTCT